MNTKKFSIIVGIVIILLISGYLIYMSVTPGGPSQIGQQEGSGLPVVDLESLDLTAIEIPNQPDADVKISVVEGLGAILVNKEGLTLYAFDEDEDMKSNCYGVCAENWPPFLLEESLSIGSYIGKDAINTTLRDDGTEQVTYEGMPLYTWINDEAPGDVTGDGVNGTWHVILL
jgi:predicted lipoprotein with Yx(FWY)xxD motif